jgi:hypothetical protein
MSNLEAYTSAPGDVGVVISSVLGVPSKASEPLDTSILPDAETPAGVRRDERAEGTPLDAELDEKTSDNLPNDPPKRPREGTGLSDDDEPQVLKAARIISSVTDISVNSGFAAGEAAASVAAAANAVIAGAQERLAADPGSDHELAPDSTDSDSRPAAVLAELQARLPDSAPPSVVELDTAMEDAAGNNLVSRIPSRDGARLGICLAPEAAIEETTEPDMPEAPAAAAANAGAASAASAAPASSSAANPPVIGCATVQDQPFLGEPRSVSADPSATPAAAQSAEEKEEASPPAATAQEGSLVEEISEAGTDAPSAPSVPAAPTSLPDDGVVVSAAADSFAAAADADAADVAAGGAASPSGSGPMAPTSEENEPAADGAAADPAGAAASAAAGAAAAGASDAVDVSKFGCPEGGTPEQIAAVDRPRAQRTTSARRCA